jgi:hypothetical protein
VEGVEATGLPGAEESGQRHAGGRALGRARAPTDLAGDDQWPQHALGGIVIGAEPRHAHELEQLALMAQQAVTQGVAGMRLAGAPAWARPKTWARSSN